MREESPVTLPASGAYPVPGHGHEVVLRGWDGDVWTGEVRPAPEGTTLPNYKRHFFGFLRDPGWKLLIVLILSTLIATALWETDRDAKWVSGIQVLMPPFALLATVVTMLALFVFLNRRVGFDRIGRETRKSIIGWGILSAFVGILFAIGIELGVPKLFDQDVNDGGWSLLAGPAEETGKLIIPVLLWIKGRFRLPREGYLLVLVSAAAFGIFESCEYAFNPDHWQSSRGVMEIMHPMFTGFIAAVAWQAAWKRESWFTGAAIGAWFIAVAVHSINDFIVLDGPDLSSLGFISIASIGVMYLLQKHTARNLVPPDNVGSVSPHWRPHAPR